MPRDSTASIKREQAARAASGIFRRARWKVDRKRSGADLLIQKDGLAYAVQVKAASEARADRLLPLTAQAVLEARTYVRQHGGGVAPLVIIAASRFPDRVAGQIREFINVHAPDVALGLLNFDGRGRFFGPGLSTLGASTTVEPERRAILGDARVDLFSDLNQWLLKVLLAEPLRSSALLGAPVGAYRNATELSSAASVSVMTAFRFLRELRVEGFLHESSPTIRLVRVDELLRRWRSATERSAPEVAARWILPGNQKQRLQHALSMLAGAGCLGLFAAADALELGFVRGGPTHIYVREVTVKTIATMGLVRVAPGQPGDVLLRTPAFRESVFRAAIQSGGMPASDVLQVWLDVANHPARGKEQAQVIFNRVLKPMIERAERGGR